MYLKLFLPIDHNENCAESCEHCSTTAEPHHEVIIVFHIAISLAQSTYTVYRRVKGLSSTFFEIV